jgi:dienelactone hydrolase
MKRIAFLISLFFLTLSLSGCGVERLLFPVFGPEYLSEPPSPPGPFAFQERRVELSQGADGEPLGITVFEPVGATGPRPALVWMLGVNNRAHYHQSFHENMASWGYVEIVPDTRDISFVDFQYHRRNVSNALLAFDLAVKGELGIQVDVEKMAFGGYSVGATMAAFAAAQEPRCKALAFWAPSPSPLWNGVKPDELLPNVTQPSLFIIGQKDIVAPIEGWPTEMQQRMTQSEKKVLVIPEGVHLFFQQPSGVDDRNPPTNTTRQEQMRIAIGETRSWLNEKLGFSQP